MTHGLRLKQQDFFVLYRSGTRVEARSFKVIYKKNNLSTSRFAVVVGRKFGKAVQRNKAKRIARSLFLEIKKEEHHANDFLFLPKKSFLFEPYRVLFGEFKKTLQNIDKEYN